MTTTQTTPSARKCSFCGESATPRKGGCIPFAGHSYAHLKCMRAHKGKPCEWCDRPSRAAGFKPVKL